MDSSYTAFAPLYDAMMHDVDYDGWADELEKCIVRYKPDTSEIADCACGTGSISVRLARKGFQVTGLDLSEDMLMVARTNAMKQGLRIPFIHMDMTKLSLHHPVDCVNCSCDGVNYLLSKEKARQFFQASYASLKSGGLLMFDISTRYKLSEILGGHCFGEDLDACTYLWTNAYDPTQKLVEMKLHMFVPQKNGVYSRMDETHIQRAHSNEEIIALLHESGFQLLASYDGISDKPLFDHSGRALYVARKN